MPKIQFIGRVLPEQFPISLTAPEIKISNARNGFNSNLHLKIEKSAITISGTVNRYTESDFGLVFVRALDLANAAVDLLGFAKGFGYRAILDYIIEPDGTKKPVVPQDVRLPALCTAYDLTADGNANFNLVFRMVTTTPGLFLALNDLISGLIHPHQARIVCFRALERIRRLIAPDDVRGPEAWKLLHETLRATEEYLTPITEIAKGPRHGDMSRSSGFTEDQVAERTWIVMNRCLEYFKRGKHPLPEPEFPLLT